MPGIAILPNMALNSLLGASLPRAHYQRVILSDRTHQKQQVDRWGSLPCCLPVSSTVSARDTLIPWKNRVMSKSPKQLSEVYTEGKLFLTLSTEAWGITRSVT